MRARTVAAVTLAILSLALVFEPALAQNDPPPAGGMVSGDWTVTDGRSYSGVAITVDHGNLVVKSGGSLTLSDVDLSMRMDSNGQFQIEVQSGGTLVVKSGCVVSSSNPSLRYNFRIRAGAVATLGNSTVRNAGYTYDGCPDDNNGIYTASDNVTIDSCTISDSEVGVFIAGASPRISNSLFRNIGSYGVFVRGGFPSLLGNDFTSGYIGIYSAGASPRISRCSFTGNYYGAYLTEFSGGRVENSSFRDHYYNGVVVNVYSNTDVRDSTFVHNGNWDWYYGGGIRYNEYSRGRCERNIFSSTDYGCAVACYDSASPVVNDCVADMTYRPAVFANYRSSPRVANSTLSTAYDGVVVVAGSSSAEVSRCTLDSDSNVGAHSTEYGTLTLANTTVRAPQSYGLYLTSSGTITGLDCDIRARYYGIYGDRGRLNLLRCNITSTESIGAIAGYGSDFTLDRCTVTAYSYGVYAYAYNTSMVLRGSWVEAKNYYGAVVSEAVLELHSSNIYATRSTALYASGNGIVRSWNSTLTTGSQTASYVYLDTGGGCVLDFYNTLFDQYRVTFTEPSSVLNVHWFVNVGVQWQNTARAANASLTIEDSANRTVFDGAVDQKGERLGLVLQEYSRTQLYWQNFTKFEFAASKNGIRKSDRRDIHSNNQTVKLVLSDPDPPVIAILSPPGNLLTNRSRIEVSGTAADFASGLASVEYSVDSGNWSAAGGLGEWNFTLDLADGKHAVRVRAYDLAGLSSVALVTISVDTVISLELDGPADGALLANGTVTVSGTAEPYSTVTAGGNSTFVDADGRFEFVMTLADGPHELAVTARDETGNSKTVTVRVVVDTVAPPLTLESPENGTRVSAPVIRFSGATEAGARLYIGGSQYSPGPDGAFSVMVPLQEGRNDLEVRAVDAAGNLRNLTVSILLDTVPPTLTIEYPGNGLLTNRPDLQVSGWTDGTAATVGGLPAAIEGGRFTASLRLVEGLARIEVIARDAVGNTNTTVLAVTLDTVAPYLQLLTPVDGSMTNKASVTVSGVTEPGVALSVNGQPAQDLNGLLSYPVRLVSGPNFLAVKAVDAAGNVAQVNRTVTLDQVPPVLSVTSPASGSRIPDSKVMVRGLTDPGSTVTVNGVLAQMERTGRFSAEIGLSEGSNSIVITSTDPAGNPTTRIVQVTRTGALSVSGSETPLLAAGLVAGLIVGAVLGLLAGRRRRKEQVVVMAPEEPEPGKYDVPEEPARADLPPPQYARADESYRPPAESHPPSEGRPDYGEPPESVYEPPMPTVPAPEAGPADEAAPMEPTPPEEPVPWEEDARPRPRKGHDVDRALDDIMKRLKT